MSTARTPAADSAPIVQTGATPRSRFIPASSVSFIAESRRSPDQAPLDAAVAAARRKYATRDPAINRIAAMCSRSRCA